MINLIDILNLIESIEVLELRAILMDSVLQGMKLYNNNLKKEVKEEQEKEEEEEEEEEEQEKEEEEIKEVLVCLAELENDYSENRFSRVYVFNNDLDSDKIKEISLKNILKTLLEENNKCYLNRLFTGNNFSDIGNLNFQFRISKKQILN